MVQKLSGLMCHIAYGIGVTELKHGAWWCTYCSRNCDNKCTADVPYYCSSVDCNFWTEEPVEQPKVKHASMKQIMKKTLVETL